MRSRVAPQAPSLPEDDQQRLGVIASWKDGPQLLPPTGKSSPPSAWSPMPWPRTSRTGIAAPLPRVSNACLDSKFTIRKHHPYRCSLLPRERLTGPPNRLRTRRPAVDRKYPPTVQLTNVRLTDGLGFYSPSPDRYDQRDLTDRKILHLSWARGSAGGAGWVWLAGGLGCCREVVISLEVRRFFCAAAECRKVTFAEPVSGLTSRHARRTPAADAVGLALGCRPGARLAGTLSCAVRRSTLLRIIRTAADPADHNPRVLGRLRASQGTRLRHHPDRRRDPPAGRHPARAVGGSSMRTSPRARCGWSGEPGNRSRRARVTPGSTRARWATGLPPPR